MYAHSLGWPLMCRMQRYLHALHHAASMDTMQGVWSTGTSAFVVILPTWSTRDVLLWFLRLNAMLLAQVIPTIYVVSVASHS